MSVQAGQPNAAHLPAGKGTLQRLGALLATLAVMSVSAGCTPRDRNESVASGRCRSSMQAMECRPATAASAIDALDRQIGRLNRRFGPAFWVAAVFPSADALTVRKALEARIEEIHASGLSRIWSRFGAQAQQGDHGRKYMHLSHRLPYPMPADSGARSRLKRLIAELSRQSSALEVCRDGDCLSRAAADERLGAGATPAERAAIRVAWARGARALVEPFETVRAELNEAAQGWGYDNMGDWWVARYEMPESEFVRRLDALTDELEPLAGALRCHVAAELNTDMAVQGRSGLLPADSLGSLAGQDWRPLHEQVRGNLPKYREVALDVEGKFSTVAELVRWAERTYISAGFPPLPESFWQGSQFTKPDREISACPRFGTNVDWLRDVRLTMCGERTTRDLVWSHGMLAFLYYDLAFAEQDWVFRDPPHLGFHFANSGTFRLALTPEFLRDQGLVEIVPAEESTLSRQLHLALRLLPEIGYAIATDLWRWQVYGSDLSGVEKRMLWKRLRARYQGVDEGRDTIAIAPLAHPAMAGTNELLPRALGHILQFQFYAEACRSAGHEGPLHQCSFYGSRDVAARLWPVLETGSSRPWSEVLAAYTGSPEMSAAPLLDYFGPLKAWLDRRNEGRACD